MAAPLRQDRRRRARAAGGAARAGAAGRSRPMVGGAAGGCPQAARPRGVQARLRGRQRRRDTGERELSRRAAFHGGLDRVALSARPGNRARPLRPHRRRRRQSDHARALVLLARPRRRSARPRTGGAHPLRSGGALSHRLLRPARPGATGRRRDRFARVAGAAAGAAPARSRARLRDPLRHRGARSRRHRWPPISPTRRRTPAR